MATKRDNFEHQFTPKTRLERELGSLELFMKEQELEFENTETQNKDNKNEVYPPTENVWRELEEVILETITTKNKSHPLKELYDSLMRWEVEIHEENHSKSPTEDISSSSPENNDFSMKEGSPKMSDSNLKQTLMYKRMRLKKGTLDNLKSLWQTTVNSDDNSDEDPFEGIDNLEENDVKLSKSAPIPVSLQKFRESNDDNDGFSDDAAEDLKMKSSSGYSYVDNKISELNTVNQAAEREHKQLNLLINPKMARALVEVLQAKQIQITSSYAKKEISYDDFEKLQSTMEKVKRNISKWTAVNTIHATKQITQKLFQRKKYKLGSFHRAANSISKTFQSLFFLDNLFQQVILDAIDSVTDQLFEILLSDMKNYHHVTKYLQRVWKNKRESGKNLKQSSNADINLMKQVKAVINGAVLAHKICSDLELFFGSNEALLRQRKITLEWLDSIKHLLHQVISPQEPVKLYVKSRASVSKVTGTTVWFT